MSSFQHLSLVAGCQWQHWAPVAALAAVGIGSQWHHWALWGQTDKQTNCQLLETTQEEAQCTQTWQIWTEVNIQTHGNPIKPIGPETHESLLKTFKGTLYIQKAPGSIKAIIHPPKPYLHKGQGLNQAAVGSIDTLVCRFTVCWSLCAWFLDFPPFTFSLNPY